MHCFSIAIAIKPCNENYFAMHTCIATINVLLAYYVCHLFGHKLYYVAIQLAMCDYTLMKNVGYDYNIVYIL